MDDLVKRLRTSKLRVMSDAYYLLHDAADRIEALDRALLSYYRYVCPTCGGRCCVGESCPENLARAALGEKKDD